MEQLGIQPLPKWNAQVSGSGLIPRITLLDVTAGSLDDVEITVLVLCTMPKLTV